MNFTICSAPNDSVKDDALLYLPCQVIACGYRKIRVPKSGATFPAFLVAIPASSTSGIIVGENEETDQQLVGKGRSVENEKVQFVWRSKRDFLVVARAVAKVVHNPASPSSRSQNDHSKNAEEDGGNLNKIGNAQYHSHGPRSRSLRQQNCGIRLLPKAALKKLAETVPWHRPEYTIFAGIKNGPTLEFDDDNMINDNKEHRSDAGEKRTGLSSHISSATLSRHEVTNLYHPSMKKSLLQLDQFLQEMHSFVQSIVQSVRTNESPVDDNDFSNASSTLYKAWSEFCRPVDTDNLVDPYEQIGHVSGLPAKEANETTKIPSRSGVTVDEKISMSESMRGIIGINNHTVENTSTSTKTESTTTTTTKTSPHRSSELGQYFCSVENGKLLIRTALQKLDQLLRCKQCDDDKNNESILFLEPSCGHGDVILQLMAELDRCHSDICSSSLSSKAAATRPQHQHQHQLLSFQNISILGYDIDANAVRTCQERLSAKCESRHNVNENDADPDNEISTDKIPFAIYCRNFLHTKASHGLNGTSMTTRMMELTESMVDSENQMETTNSTRGINNCDMSIVNGDSFRKRPRTDVDGKDQPDTESATNINFPLPLHGIDMNKNDSSTVVCIGGPPYTTGPGKSDDIQRDLPHLFIQHCLNEWRAQIIVFLLPTRYRKYYSKYRQVNGTSSTTESVRKIENGIDDDADIEMNTRDKKYKNSHDEKNKDERYEEDKNDGFSSLSIPSGYKMEMINLPDSNFYFQGSVKVVQPSLLLCIYPSLLSS